MQRSSKILLAGASGLLGHTLAPFLREVGHEVTTVGLSNAAAADMAVDTTDAKAVEAVLDAVRPDIIVNLVALTDVDLCEERPDIAWRLNVMSVETLAGWTRQAQGCHLIQVSTDQVYDGAGPHKEDAVDVINVYGLSKYAGELAALLAEATVLRTNFFGPSRLAGRASFSDWILAKLRAGESFTGFDDVLFSPLTMTMLSAALARVIEVPKAGVYNLGSRGGCSKADFAVAVARRFGLDPGLIHRGPQSSVALKARRPADMRMDSALFEAAFDFILPDTQEEIDGLEDA